MTDTALASAPDARRAIVLFSGGQDSTACLAWALERFAQVETLGFDYGQRHRIELDCRLTVLDELRHAFPAWAARLGEDHVLDLIIGEGPSARSVRIDLAPFTLIGATTRAGLLATPLRDRFGIPIRLEFYSPEELLGVLQHGARRMGLNLTTEGATEIAARARGTPRVAGRLLRRVRDFADAEGSSAIDRIVAARALSRLEVDEAGLDRLDRSFLKALIENYGGGPVGMDTLAAAIAEARDAVEDVIEPYLLQQGFIQRTPRGRVACARAYVHLGLDAPPPGASCHRRSW